MENPFKNFFGRAEPAKSPEIKPKETVEQKARRAIESLSPLQRDFFIAIDKLMAGGVEDSVVVPEGKAYVGALTDFSRRKYQDGDTSIQVSRLPDEFFGIGSGSIPATRIAECAIRSRNQDGSEVYICFSVLGGEKGFLKHMVTFSAEKVRKLREAEKLEADSFSQINDQLEKINKEEMQRYGLKNEEELIQLFHQKTDFKNSMHAEDPMTPSQFEMAMKSPEQLAFEEAERKAVNDERYDEYIKQAKEGIVDFGEVVPDDSEIEKLLKYLESLKQS